MPSSAFRSVLRHAGAGDEFTVIDYAGNEYRFTVELEKALTPQQAGKVHDVSEDVTP